MRRNILICLGINDNEQKFHDFQKCLENIDKWLSIKPSQLGCEGTKQETNISEISTG